ncbi:heavy metal-associated isoprenylated plant protein 2-like [Zingiber officinale]|uniref:heavy metal-associated isoprenylated plant protein 2-like n=1 Tax=Zingiber officinale TaxID=94328 RepID=UPI001C4BDAE1|nr:heavy metal-associated isoprenylated plant protein 2-like [Zingiber officinale]
MPEKKIVLKVIIMCNKCKVSVMRTVVKFDGVTSVALDVEKSTVTIVGTVDAVLIVKALRKAKKQAEIVTVEKPDKKDEKKSESSKDLPPCCGACAYVVHDDYQPNLCIITQ